MRTGGFNGLFYIVFIFRLLPHIKEDLRHCTKIYFVHKKGEKMRASGCNRKVRWSQAKFGLWRVP